ETFAKYRSKDLERGLREMLNGPQATNILPKFYDHPLIYGLFRGRYDPHNPGNLPSYIPAKTFALTVLDLVKQEPDDSYLKKTLTPLIHAASNDFGRAQKNIEDWYNGSMDRVSGWYKRRTQIIIATLGFVIAFGFNVDTIDIARFLNVTPAARTALIAQATSTTLATGAALDGLSAAIRVTDIPIGWTANQTAVDKKIVWRALPDSVGAWILKIAGLLATGLAISLGAPFWFDVLNKFMVVRSTVKPEEKSQEEPSKA